MKASIICGKLTNDSKNSMKEEKKKIIEIKRKPSLINKVEISRFM